MTKTTLEQLSDMRVLLSNPAHWAKGSIAYDAHGNKVHPYHELAVCWCLAGAAIRTGGVSEVRNALRNAISEWRDQHFSIVIFNDDPATTHADILRVIDTAIINKTRPRKV